MNLTQAQYDEAEEDLSFLAAISTDIAGLPEFAALSAAIAAMQPVALPPSSDGLDAASLDAIARADALAIIG